MVLLVESRSLTESREIDTFLQTALDLADAGNEVSLWLLQNAVLITREESEILERLRRHPRVRITADELALRRRALELAVDGIAVADLDRFVAELMQPDTKTVWH
jgi:sulfur transfer complex TusBCD TusB component (DsrH family)